MNTLETFLDDPKQSSETTPIPAVDSSLTKSVVVHSSVPAIGLQPLPVTVEDVQRLVISAVSEPSQTSDQPLQDKVNLAYSRRHDC